MAPYFKISIIFLESLLSQGHYSYINIIFVSSFELRMSKSEHDHLYACPNLKKIFLECLNQETTILTYIWVLVLNGLFRTSRIENIPKLEDPYYFTRIPKSFTNINV